MKKVFLLPLFAMAVFASGAWAQFCDWGPCVGGNEWNCTTSGGCYEDEKGDGVCQGGSHVTCCPRANMPPAASSKPACGDAIPDVQLYCAWNGLNCWAIVDAERADCESSATVYRDVPPSGRGEGKKCAGGTYVSGLDPNVHYDWCDWGECSPSPEGEYKCSDGGCFKIPNEPDAQERLDCNKIVTEESKCDPNSYSIGRKKELGISSIVSVPKAQGLTIMANGKVLHILSARDAQVSLFDLSGSVVLSGNVKAGNSEFSLKTLKQGIYYAKVQSGSHTQTVKVMLK